MESASRISNRKNVETVETLENGRGSEANVTYQSALLALNNQPNYCGLVKTKPEKSIPLSPSPVIIVLFTFRY